MNPVVLLVDLPERLARYFFWLGPLAARIAMGCVFVVGGWTRLNGPGDMAEAFIKLGFPFATDTSPAIAVVQIACGALLILGLLTRPVAALLIGGLVYQILTIDIPGMGDDPTPWFRWLETTLGFTRTEYCALLIFLVIAGPGPLSLDALASRGGPGLLSHRVLRFLGWLGPLAPRIVGGYVYMWAGWGKLIDIPTFVDRFTQWGIPAPQIMTPIVAGAEFVFGILVLLGLFTRISSVVLLIVSLVAIVAVKFADLAGFAPTFMVAGFFNFDEALYMAMFGWLAISGPGPVSLDYALQRMTGSKPDHEAYPSGARAVI